VHHNDEPLPAVLPGGGSGRERGDLNIGFEQFIEKKQEVLTEAERAALPGPDLDAAREREARVRRLEGPGPFSEAFPDLGFGNVLLQMRLVVGRELKAKAGSGEPLSRFHFVSFRHNFNKIMASCYNRDDAWEVRTSCNWYHQWY